MSVVKTATKLIICEGTPDLDGYTRRFPFILLLMEGSATFRISFANEDPEILDNLLLKLNKILKDYGSNCKIPFPHEAFDSFLASKRATLLHDFGCKLNLYDLEPFIREEFQIFYNIKLKIDLPESFSQF